MVFNWLRNLLFTPKQAQISELMGLVATHERRITTLEQSAYSTMGKLRREEQNSETEALLAEAAVMLKEGKPAQEVMATLLVKNPGVALRIAKQYGFKI